MMRDYLTLGDEPKLTEILEDPVVQYLMRYDQVTEADVYASAKQVDKVAATAEIPQARAA